MRTKTRTTVQLKPGMVIESVAYDAAGNLLPAAHRVVASNTKTTPWAERRITFTDGTYRMSSNAWQFDVARGKSVRNSARSRAAIIPTFALADALNLLGGYARTAVAA